MPQSSGGGKLLSVGEIPAVDACLNEVEYLLVFRKQAYNI
jgi:hypothetical protein